MGLERWEEAEPPGEHAFVNSHAKARRSGGGGGGAAEQEAWPLVLQLSNGRFHGCDVAISATGVLPNTEALPAVCARAADGGLRVDRHMRVLEVNNSGGPGACPVGGGSVYAAGDCASLEWPQPGGEETERRAAEASGERKDAGDERSTVWFQMRLWSQARTQGAHAALCMAGEADELSGGGFEIFAHASRFFGYKVRVGNCRAGR